MDFKQELDEAIRMGLHHYVYSKPGYWMNECSYLDSDYPWITWTFEYVNGVGILECRW